MKIPATAEECVTIVTEKETANENEIAFVTGVDNGTSTEKEKKNGANGTSADPRSSDVPAATQMPSVDAITRDGMHDLSERDGINACHPRSGGQVLLQHQEDDQYLHQVSPSVWQLGSDINEHFQQEFLIRFIECS